MDLETGKAWKGLLASFILSGAGQYFSGARRRGLIWFTIAWFIPFGFLLLYNLPFIPAKLGIVLLPIALIIWLVMLWDSYCPIKSLYWWGWIVLILVSLALSILTSLATHQLFSAYKVPTGSMAPTISRGDNVLVVRYAYWFRSPKRGDIIVFDTSGIPQISQDPFGKKVFYDKRVIGIPGDTVEILDPEIRINGVEMKFGDQAHPIPYHHSPQYKVSFPPDKDIYVVPKDKYFVLGDNSYNAFDSRYWGTIPREAIYGKVTKIYWPWNRMSTPQ